MTVVVSPPELDIDPVFCCDCAIIIVFWLMQQWWLADLPFVSGEEKNICAAWVHLVGLTRVYRFFLDSVNFKTVKFHVEYLAQVHNDGFMDFLPQMSSENLDKTDF